MKNDPNNGQFADLMSDVTPLNTRAQKHALTPKSKIHNVATVAARRHAASNNNKQEDTNITTVPQFGPEDALLFIGLGLDKASMRKLRQGLIRPSCWLDLHGDTVIKAQRHVRNAIQQALDEGHRCMLVIHGKGGKRLDTNTHSYSKPQANDSAKTSSRLEPAVLKNHIYQWLAQHSQVLGFCSATPKDGGTGAVYVLLRNQKKQKKRR